jgi:hypothetical protein
VESHSRSDDPPLLLHMGNMGSLVELAQTLLESNPASNL